MCKKSACGGTGKVNFQDVMEDCLAGLNAPSWFFEIECFSLISTECLQY